jgi:hypothetical protein
MKSVFIAAALGIAFCAASLPASAEPTKKDDSYGYIFTDDALKAETNGSATAMIKVIPMGRRDRLLRPRVHFVPEMLKSVENM